MYCCCYLRRGFVYIPTEGMTKDGLLLVLEPIAVLRVEDTAGLRRAFIETIQRGNPAVPSVGREWTSPMLARAGVSSWSAFARGAATWSIAEKDGVYQIGYYRRLPRNGWVPDESRTITFPAGTDVEEVCQRMITILQETADG